MADPWFAAVERATEHLRCGECGQRLSVDLVIRWRSARWICHDCQWALQTWDPAGFFAEYGHA